MFGWIRKRKRQPKETRKEYILWVTEKAGNGYSSRWYGWSINLTLSYNEAVRMKEQLEEDYLIVDIVPFKEERLG